MPSVRQFWSNWKTVQQWHGLPLVCVLSQAVQQKAQSDAAKLQLEDKKLQAKQIESQQKEQNDLQTTQIKAQVDLIKNREDNDTALTISGMRIATGNNAGNMKNGNSIDQDF